MKVYVCDECGYDYDPEIGDLENGIEPETPFKRLPGDWVCPECGAGKNQFSILPDDDDLDDLADLDDTEDDDF